MRTPTTVALLAFLLSGCSVGGVDAGDDDDSAGDDDDGGDDEPVIERYTLSASPADQTIRLAETADYTLALSSENFDGPVELAVTGLPATWTATFSPSSTAELAANQDTEVTLTISMPSSAEAVAATLGITATGAKGEVAASTALTVLPELIVNIAPGTGSGPHGFQNVAVRAGTTIHFTNSDGTGHRIHSTGIVVHQGATMGTGQSYDVTMLEAGDTEFYCHDHGDGTGVAQLVVLP